MPTTKALVQQMLRECVARRSHANHKHVLPVVAQRVRSSRIYRVPSRQQRHNLKAIRQPQHFAEDPRLDLWNVHRILFLKYAGLHAVVADAMTGARTIGLSIIITASAPIGWPSRYSSIISEIFSSSGQPSRTIPNGFRSIVPSFL